MRSPPQEQAVRAGELLGPGSSTASRELVDVLLAVSARTERIEQRLTELHQIVGSGKEPKEWLSTAEFAAEIDRAEFTVRSACNSKRLRAEKTRNGREWRIPRSELERYRRQGLLPVGS